MAFSPDGARLASAGSDGVVRVWEAASGDLIAMLVGATSGWAVLLPDGSYKLALTDDPGNTVWWTVKDVRFEAGELDGHLPSIRRLPIDTPLPPPSA